MFEFIDVKYREVLNLPALLIAKEEVTTLVGPSGSGKTSILRMLNKMISPTQGRIMFNGTDLNQLNSVAHRRQVVMLSQNPVMFEGSIRDNLTIGLKFHEKAVPDEKVLQEILAQVNLGKPLDGAVNTLSGGEKQRLAIGRVLLLDPEVYLLDEPSSALDDVTEDIIIQMLVQHVRKENKTMVMVTHSKEIAEQFSDTINEIVGGRCLSRRGSHEKYN